MEHQNEQIERIEEGFTGATIPHNEPEGRVEGRKRGRSRKEPADAGSAEGGNVHTGVGATGSDRSGSVVGSDEEAPKRRGRKPKDESSAEFCSLVIPAGTVLVASGFAAVGKARGNAIRHEGYPAEVATAIAEVWAIPSPAAAKVAEPLARILDRMLPDRAKKFVGQAADPLALAEALWGIVTHCMETEQRLLTAWQQQPKAINNPLDGKLPNPDLAGVGGEF